MELWVRFVDVEVLARKELRVIQAVERGGHQPIMSK
jgi:hypothetical protein